MRDFRKWCDDAKQSKLRRLEERLDFPATSVAIDYKNYQRLKNYFEMERYFQKYPAERERLRRESEC